MRRRDAEAVVTGIEENVPGSTSDDLMEISEDLSDYDSDVDADTDSDTEGEPGLYSLRSQSNQTPPHSAREESTDGSLKRLTTNGDVEAKLEEPAEDYIDNFVDNLHRHGDLATSGNNEVEVKAEGDLQMAGERHQPIFVADDDDDGDDDIDDSSLFFPSRSDSDPSSNPTITVDNHEADGMQGRTTSKEPELKEELERKRIESVQTMEGPREVIVIDDD